MTNRTDHAGAAAAPAGRVPVVTTAFAAIGLPALAVFPGVFNLEPSLSGKFLARVLARHPHLFAGADVLDVGCGAGILGLVCMVHGARAATCTDLSPSAAENAAHNAAALGLPLDTRVGDLFDGLDPGRRYDLIAFNPPGFEGVPATAEEAHFVCPFAVIDAFYRTAGRYLTPGGAVLSATSDVHDPARSPRTMAERHGHAAELLATGTFDRGRQYAYLVRPGS